MARRVMVGNRVVVAPSNRVVVGCNCNPCSPVCSQFFTELFNADFDSSQYNITDNTGDYAIEDGRLKWRYYGTGDSADNINRCIATTENFKVGDKIESEWLRVVRAHNFSNSGAGSADPGDTIPATVFGPPFQFIHHAMRWDVKQNGGSDLFIASNSPLINVVQWENGSDYKFTSTVLSIAGSSITYQFQVRKDGVLDHSSTATVFNETTNSYSTWIANRGSTGSGFPVDNYFSVDSMSSGYIHI